MSTYMVGIAIEDITPSDDWIQTGRIYQAGFASRKCCAEGIGSKISARALSICDNQNTCIVLASLDLCAADPNFTQTVRNRITASRGLLPEQVLINVTHTHSAPVTSSWPTWDTGFDKPDDGYMEFLKERVVSAIERAIDSKQAASVSFARGKTSIGVNRHPPSEVYDQTLDVIRATGQNGNTMAVAFFHGCHPIAKGDSLLISPDYPGYARETVEAAVGGVALFFQGYGGTINPTPSWDVERTGVQLGVDVINLLKGPMHRLEGPIASKSIIIQGPLQPLDPAAIERAKQSPYSLDRNWANIMEKSGASAPSFIPIELQMLRVGIVPRDWRLVVSSHEVVAEFATPVRAIWPYERVTLLGYSNSENSYVPSTYIMTNPLWDFPSWNNYEGNSAFVVYGWRAPLTSDIDWLFINGHIETMDMGWKLIGHAQDVVAMTALNGRLFAVTRQDQLWWRDPVEEDIPWTHMGHAQNVVGMAALNGKLFVATDDGKLWWRDPYGFDIPWEHIGHAQEVVAMTALNGKLFAATKANKLWLRDPVVGHDIPWKHIGHAEDIAGLAAADGKLIAATRGGNLFWREPVEYDIIWKRFGHAEDVVGLTSLNNKLFAATLEGQLWQRDL